MISISSSSSPDNKVKWSLLHNLYKESLEKLYVTLKPQDSYNRLPFTYQQSMISDINIFRQIYDGLYSLNEPILIQERTTQIFQFFNKFPGLLASKQSHSWQSTSSFPLKQMSYSIYVSEDYSFLQKVFTENVLFAMKGKDNKISSNYHEQNEYFKKEFPILSSLVKNIENDESNLLLNYERIKHFFMQINTKSESSPSSPSSKGKENELMKLNRLTNREFEYFIVLLMVFELEHGNLGKFIFDKFLYVIKYLNCSIETAIVLLNSLIKTWVTPTSSTTSNLITSEQITKRMELILQTLHEFVEKKYEFLDIDPTVDDRGLEGLANLYLHLLFMKIPVPYTSSPSSSYLFDLTMLSSQMIERILLVLFDHEFVDEDGDEENGDSSGIRTILSSSSSFPSPSSTTSNKEEPEQSKELRWKLNYLGRVSEILKRKIQETVS
jgi:hypothetical protein